MVLVQPNLEFKQCTYNFLSQNAWCGQWCICWTYIYIYIICVSRNNWMKRNKMPFVNFCKAFRNIFQLFGKMFTRWKMAQDLLPANIDFDRCALATGIFPDSLKIAKAIILYKRNIHGLVDSSRPVSLLTSFQLYSKKLQIFNSPITSKSTQAPCTSTANHFTDWAIGRSDSCGDMHQDRSYWPQRVIWCYSDICRSYILHVMLPFANR